MVEAKNLKKPFITDKGKVFIITEAFPPVSAGSSVLNKNLLSFFNKKSYVVFTTKTRFKKQLDKPIDVDVRYVSTSFEHVSSKIHRYLLPVQMWFAKKRIIKIAKKEKPVAIIATYPSYYYLALGYEVSKILKRPFVPYFHDTLVEALRGTPLEESATRLQAKIWKDASVILVMSDGIKNLYKRKYNIDSVPIVHTYLENVAQGGGQMPITPKNKLRAFWAGDIYGINDNALARLVPALNSLGHTVEFATPRTCSDLIKMGISMEANEVSFYSNRKEYLEALDKADILLLALNSPNECSVDFDELSTIFPTKTPEYLSSGKLIIAYAPNEYFLTRFFKDNNCGLVFHTLNRNELQAQLHMLLSHNDHDLIRNNALRVAGMFQQNLVAESFRSAISNLL